MIALTCKHEHKTRHGKNRNGSQRWKCKSCQKTISDVHVPTGPLGDMQSDPTKVFLALNLLCEGMAVRGASRVTGLKQETITKAIMLVGEKCEKFFDQYVKNVNCTVAEIDEIWEKCGCLERNKATTKLKGYCGDVWSFFGICADSKLILAFESGRRTLDTADAFLTKLRRAIAGRVQITSDGLPAYKHGVPMKFLSDVDYSILIKTYKSEQVEKRYSPAQINTVEKISQFGNPDMSKCSTSYIERFNLSLRTALKRFNRLSVGYSKNVDVHCAMLSIWICFYNFGKVHSTIKTTPAMRAGITDRKWTIREIAEWN